MRWGTSPFGDPDAIPDGDDADMDPGNETSHIVTTHYRPGSTEHGTALDNGERYYFQLRAANANGGGPWTEARGGTPLAKGVPAAPTGVVQLLSG